MKMCVPLLLGEVIYKHTHTQNHQAMFVNGIQIFYVLIDFFDVIVTKRGVC